MKKRYQLILFIVIVSLGILMIDNWLFGIIGERCPCEDTMGATLDCNDYCRGYGGCDDIWLLPPGYCLDFICCTKVYYFCSEGAHYAYSYSCVECDDCDIY